MVDEIKIPKGFVSDLKEIDKVVLSRLKKNCVFTPPFCISGGYLRDSVLGREVKDIDVLLHEFAVPYLDLEWDEYGEDDFRYQHGYVKRVSKPDQALFNGLNVEFIIRSVSSWPQDVPNYHTIGLSNIFWHENQLTFHETFLKDVEDQKIRVYNHHNSPGKQKYLDKIKKKYDWEIEEVDNDATISLLGSCE